jgi:Tfp pilus assembly protein PilF
MRRRLLSTSSAFIAVFLVGGCTGSRQVAWPEPTVAALSTPTPAESSLKRGLRHLHDGHSGLAVAELQKAAAEGAPSERTLNLLGVAYDQLGRHDLARTYFARALALKPDSGEILHNIGYSFYLEDDLDQARAYFQQALGSEDEVIQAQARGRLMVIDSKATPARAEATPQVRQVLQRGLHRTGERTYELRTAPAAAPPLDVPPAKPSRANTAEAKPVPAEPMPAPQPAPALPARTKSVPMTGVPVVYAPTPTLQIELANGAGRRKLAARMSGMLSARGLAPYYLTNADHFAYEQTTIIYPEAYAEAAARVADALPVRPTLTPRADATRLRVILGADILPFDVAPATGTASAL